jgi:hypothetical protein
MKQNIIKAALALGVLLALSQSTIPPVFAQSGLQVTFSTNPTVVAPGTDGYLMVNLRAIGDSADNIQIIGTSMEGNIITAHGNWDITVGSIDGGATYAVPFEFTVATTAPFGLYQIEFDIYYSGGSKIHQTAMLDIEQPSFIDLASVTPASVNIGQKTTVDFNFTNTGKTIYNVLFTWQDANGLILPLGTDNKVTIPVLRAGNITTVPVTLMASPSLSPGIYPLTITLKFFDQSSVTNQTGETMTSTVGLQVSGATSFEIVASQSTTGTTSLTVINTGANTANSVIVSIPQQLSYTVTGIQSTSLGNLDPGDYSLASFQVTSSSQNSTMPFGFNRSGNFTPPSGQRNSNNRSFIQNRTFSGFGGNGLSVTITYTDSFGNRQTEQKQVSLSSSSSGLFTSLSSRTRSSTTGTFGTTSTSSSSSGGLTYIIVGIVGIILIATIVYVGRKKKLPGVSRLLKRRKE